MNKFFMLMLSAAAICGTSPVFAMDPPDQFNEDYHQLPTILVDIQEELNFEKLKTLKRQIRTSPSYLTFKDKNGFVYTIDDNFPNSCGYLSQKIVERWGHTKHPLIDLMITKLSYTNDCITHNYVGAKEPQLYIAEPESIVFKKIDLRQYLQSSSPSFDSRSVPLSEVTEYLERSKRKS